MNTTITSHNLTVPVRPAKRAGTSTGMGARYDSARTTPENANYWKNADTLSANAINDTHTRRKLRSRSRYEEQNNGYMSGLVSDRSNETIGSGPRLQLSLPDATTDPDFQVTTPIAPDLAAQVRRKWCEWTESIGLHDKLLIMDESETRDGEVFGLKITNPLLPPDAPQLDLRLYESDQIDTPDMPYDQPGRVSGIVFDQHGNPIEYHFLKYHPGDWYSGFGVDYDKVPAGRVIHWFKAKRPGQARGIPALQSSLPLMGMQRAYTQAALGSAEVQARIPVVIEQEYQLPDGDGDEGDDSAPPFKEVHWGSVNMMTMPPGAKAKGFDNTQPVAEYSAFKTEILTEAGRPINAPRSVSTGSSADYNYASGRLDRQNWQRAIKIRRERYALVVLDNLFRAWLREAILIPGYLPQGLPPVADWQWTWRWDGFVSADPQKDVDANASALESGQTTLDRVCGEAGEDWVETMQQRAKEAAMAKSLGLADPFAKSAPSLTQQPPPQDPQGGTGDY